MTLHEVDMFGVIEHEQSFWKRKRCISRLVCKNFKLYCLSQHWEWPAVVGLQGALWSRQWTGVNISSQEMDDISNFTNSTHQIQLKCKIMKFSRPPMNSSSACTRAPAGDPGTAPAFALPVWHKHCVAPTHWAPSPA